MKYIFRALILFLLLFSGLYANEYRSTKIIKLKKDENKKIIIKYAKVQKLFKFRWTLYVNGGLVILRAYDRVVAQNILYKRYKNQTFRLPLKIRGADLYNPPYILVKFLEFDYEKNEAIFKLFLSDKSSQVSLEYLENS